MPSRKTITKIIIPEIYAEYKEKIVDKIKESTNVNITYDCWTAQDSRSFITLTTNSLDQQLNPATHILSTRELKENHSSENLNKQVIELLEEYKIDVNKSTSIFTTTDCGTDVLKAAKILKKSILL